MGVVSKQHDCPFHLHLLVKEKYHIKSSNKICKLFQIYKYYKYIIDKNFVKKGTVFYKNYHMKTCVCYQLLHGKQYLYVTYTFLNYSLQMTFSRK